MSLPALGDAEEQDDQESLSNLQDKVPEAQTPGGSTSGPISFLLHMLHHKGDKSRCQSCWQVWNIYFCILFVS